MEQLSKPTIGFSLSFAIVCIFNGLLVILKETVVPINNWMTALTGNHWITHGLFDILVFVIFGYTLSKMNFKEKFNVKTISNIIIFSTVVGLALIVVFNLVR